MINWAWLTSAAYGVQRHKSFRRTRSSSFEKEGIRLGRTSTPAPSFDQTVYMLQIPTDSAQLVEKALRITQNGHAPSYDGPRSTKSAASSLKSGVWGRGASERVFDKHLPNSCTIHNMRNAVIGKKEIMKSSSRDVRRFFRDCVPAGADGCRSRRRFRQGGHGAIDQGEVLGLKKSDIGPTQVDFPIPRHPETMVSIATDKELPIRLSRCISSEMPRSSARQAIIGKASSASSTTGCSTRDFRNACRNRIPRSSSALAAIHDSSANRRSIASSLRSRRIRCSMPWSIFSPKQSA